LIPKEIIISFFIFIILIISYAFGIVEFTNEMVFGMIFFWIVCMSFDLHTTFQRKELLQYETNPILSYLLEKTTIKKTILLYISFQVLCILFLPVIFFWQIDFVYSGIFAVFAGVIHIIGGISNQKLMKDFDSKDLIF